MKPAPFHSSPASRSANKSAPLYLGAERASAPLEPPLEQLALRQFLLDLIVLVFHVAPNQLMARSRGRKQTAFARQVAMYLAHVTGGLSLSAVGRLFARDRTTVAHACALVEDARDDERLDRTLEHLESALSCQMQFVSRETNQ